MRRRILALGLSTWMLALPTAGRACDETAESPVVSEVYVSTAAEMAPQVQTGSLLFSEGDCLAIRAYTASSYTHVAVVCVEGGEPIVYDSMNGVGVRRLSLADYLVAESPHEVQIFNPRTSLTEEQGRLLETYLRSQLGRPYGVKHHLTGERAEGIHCAEYATDALMSIELIHAERPPKVSPASLATGITAAELYSEGPLVELEPPAIAQEPATNRCHQLWIDTKLCTIHCCDKLAGWFLCR